VPGLAARRPGELAQLAVGVAEQLALLQADVGPLGIALRVTDTYSPAAIDSAPATSPATPAVMIAAPGAPDAATPSTRLEVDRMPSLAPSTPARSQLDR